MDETFNPNQKYILQKDKQIMYIIFNKEDIINHLSKKFAKWQLPDEVKFVDEIPKTSVGKFKKSVIRELYKDEYMSKQG
jgi:acyl-CoA synthetase (AMP-forming)/AMP-acid ligase II